MVCSRWLALASSAGNEKRTSSSLSVNSSNCENSYRSRKKCDEFLDQVLGRGSSRRYGHVAPSRAILVLHLRGIVNQVRGNAGLLADFHQALGVRAVPRTDDQ